MLNESGYTPVGNKLLELAIKVCLLLEEKCTINFAAIISLMHVYVKLANFTPKPRFRSPSSFYKLLKKLSYGLESKNRLKPYSPPTL